MSKIKYLYKAANKAGQTVEGIIEATDKGSVISTLRQKSLYLLNLSEISPKTAMEINIGSAKIPKRALAVFCTQFSSILKAGVPLSQALSILNEQMENKKLKSIVQSVFDDLQRGKGLSEAFSMHEKMLPSIMIKMIEAGELSGTLDLSLQRLAQHFEKEYQIAKKIKSAMMYPIIVSIVAVIVVIFLLIFILPRFATFFESADELPSITRFMMSLSDAIVNGWMYIVGFILLVVGIFKFYKSTDNGRLQLDTLKLHAPVLKKSITRILAARFARTMATLTSTGITLTQALRISSKVVSNKLAENKLMDVEEQIRQGWSLHAAIKASELFPNMLMHMTKIGEESGTLDQMLEKAAAYFEEEADAAITKLTAFIQPILLVFVAVIVVFIMLSVLLPMFSVYDTIG